MGKAIVEGDQPRRRRSLRTAGVSYLALGTIVVPMAVWSVVTEPSEFLGWVWLALGLFQVSSGAVFLYRYKTEVDKEHRSTSLTQRQTQDGPSIG